MLTPMNKDVSNRVMKNVIIEATLVGIHTCKFHSRYSGFEFRC